MKDMNAFNLKNFSTVWERVADSKGQEKAVDKVAGDREVLEQLIAREYESEMFYRALAQIAKSARAVLNRIANEEKSHASALQIEYYLLYGDTYVPKMCHLKKYTALKSLRTAYLAELEDERRYLQEASHTKNETLAILYNKHAREEVAQAYVLRDIISAALGN